MNEDLDFGRVLITGGAGFIGSHLHDKLVRAGNQVTILDNLSSGFKSNIPGAKIVAADIRDSHAVRTVSRAKNVIFHFAEYIPNSPGHIIKYSASQPLRDLGVSVGGTINVLEGARKNDSHFVLASTAAVYGSRDGFLKEEAELHPISAYGVSKLCAEEYANLYHESYGLPITIARFFNVYGPRQRKYLVFDCLKKLQMNSIRIQLLGNGQETRDYIYVDDALEYLARLALLGGKESKSTFNVGTGVGRSTLEVVESIARLRGISPEVLTMGNAWKGNSKSLVADMTKTRKLVHKSLMDFDASLRRVVAWYDSL